MLVVIGANGRTGLEIVKQALAAGRTVRPVCRDDRDTRVLDGVVDVQDICYADPDHPASLAPVLEGARQVVVAIDPRVAGPGAPMYGPHAGEACVEAATAAGAEVALYLSVAGGYRWSPSRLNRKSFHLDRWVRRSDAKWSMMRFSCFADEVLEGHVRPPDGGRPHPVPRSSRWAPLTRADAARAVLSSLAHSVPGRTIYVGGPRAYSSTELEAAIAPWRVDTTAAKTRFLPLPPGDLSVLPDATWVSLGFSLEEGLEDVLAPPSAARPELVREAEPEGAAPVPEAAPEAASASPPVPVPQRPPPGPHPADEGRDYKVTAEWGPDLRRVVHTQLVEDLARLGLPTDGVTLQLRYARSRPEPRAEVHDGVLQPLTGVRALSSDGEVLHSGGVDFLHDRLAEELRIWWVREDGDVPAALWDALDMGVQRRAARDPRWQDVARVQAVVERS